MAGVCVQVGRGCMDQQLRRMWSEDEGQDLVEYALIVLFIGVAIIGAFSAFTGGISTAFSQGISAL
jgi:Flp pilus assembly pilin Flp